MTTIPPPEPRHGIAEMLRLVGAVRRRRAGRWCPPGDIQEPVRSQWLDAGPIGSRRPNRGDRNGFPLRDLEGARTQPGPEDSRGPPPVGRVLRKRTVTSGVLAASNPPVGGSEMARRHQGRHGG